MRLVFSSLLGFLIGAAVTVLVTVLGVYLALSAERSVSLASIVDVTFVPDGPVAFDMALSLGWLGFVLPIAFLVGGLGVGALRQGHTRRAV